MQEEMQTFEFGNGFGDVGGEAIDLKSLDMTDTLIGSAYCELTSALGEAESNLYESYHAEDNGISDIQLVTFDSALIQDAGVRLYLEDNDANKEKSKDLDKLINEKLENEISIDIENMNRLFLTGLVLTVDTEYAMSEKEDDCNEFIEQDIPFTEDGYIDEEAMSDDDDFTDADFDEQDKDFEEYLPQLQEDYENGKYKFLDK